jgi:UDPglucose 6-dehydrogenase
LFEDRLFNEGQMRISIIGAGVTGRASGLGLISKGHDILFYDINQQVLQKLREEGYRVADRLDDLDKCQVHMICVPTPSSRMNAELDLSYVCSAISDLSKVLKKKDSFHVIAIRSTVTPSTNRKIIIPLLRERSSLTLGTDYGLCYNPEFLREAHSLEDFLQPSVIVIGEYNRRSGDVISELYQSFGSQQIRTDLENAEAIKCFANVYNVMKISFFNEIYLISKKAGLDQDNIARALIRASLGLRIPEYYSVGGHPYDGKCLPKDLAAVIEYTKSLGISPHLFEAISEINEEMKKVSS